MSEEKAKKEIEQKETKGMSRRTYLKIVGGAAVGAAVAGTAGYLIWNNMQQSAKKQTLKYMGNPFYDPAEMFTEWKRVNNQDVEPTYLEFFAMTQTTVASGGDGWDVAATLSNKPLIDQGVYRPIPLSKAPNWKNENMLPVLTSPENYLPAGGAQRYNYCNWEVKGQSLKWIPIVWGVDTIAYLPEFLPFQENGATQKTLDGGELWKSEWKGRVGVYDLPNETLGFVARYLETTQQMTIQSHAGNLTTAEVDKVYNYLLPLMQAGQVKTVWVNYSDIVTLLSTKEIYLTLCIEPVVFDVRKTETPCYYANLKDGYCLWMNGEIVSPKASSAVLDDAYGFADYHLTPWYVLTLARTGYMSPAFKNPEVKTSMGNEFYDWFFDGKATYLSADDAIKEVWPNRSDIANLPARLKRALFLPATYFNAFYTGGTPRTGSPHANGQLRDTGSVDDRMAQTKWFAAPDWPDNMDYYTTKFQSLKSSMPT